WFDFKITNVRTLNDLLHQPVVLAQDLLRFLRRHSTKRRKANLGAQLWVTSSINFDWQILEDHRYLQIRNVQRTVSLLTVPGNGTLDFMVSSPPATSGLTPPLYTIKDRNCESSAEYRCR